MNAPTGKTKRWKQWPVWVAGFCCALAVILVHSIETSQLTERAVGSWVLKMSYWPISELWEAVVFHICRIDELDGFQMVMWEAGSVVIGTLWYFHLARGIRFLLTRRRNEA